MALLSPFEDADKPLEKLDKNEGRWNRKITSVNAEWSDATATVDCIKLGSTQPTGYHMHRCCIHWCEIDGAQQ